MANPRKIEHRGGARPGSGRKKETLTAVQVREMLSAAKKYAKKYGKSIDEILLDFIYAEGNARDRLAAIKLWKEYTVAKLQEGGETDTTVTPELYLPEKRPDLKVVGGSDVQEGKEAQG